MTCGKKSKNRFEYRVLDKDNTIRNFCSKICLSKYYRRVSNQERKNTLQRLRNR